jgi:hypothetical protein
MPEVGGPNGHGPGEGHTGHTGLPPVQDWPFPPAGYEYGEARRGYVEPYAE